MEKNRFFEIFYLSEAAQERIIQKEFKKGGFGIILDGIKYCLCGKMEVSTFLKEHLLRRVWMF